MRVGACADAQMVVDARAAISGITYVIERAGLRSIVGTTISTLSARLTLLPPRARADGESNHICGSDGRIAGSDSRTCTNPHRLGGIMVRINFNRLRFLVIDDNAHMRRIMRSPLHGFGTRDVYEAEDGAAGLETFIQYGPDIVITDWVMPI